MSFNSLSSLKGIELCSNLRLLNAAHNRLITYAPLARNVLLEEIYLSKNMIHSIQGNYHMNWTKLRILDLQGNKIADDTAQVGKIVS